MNPQSITISGRPFFKYRALMDAMLNKSIEKMLAAGVNEGTVMGQIAIRLIRSEDEKTGEIQIRPQFVFNTTMSIPVKVSDKDAAEEDFIIFIATKLLNCRFKEFCHFIIFIIFRLC